jgi:hypothetical protein
MPAPAPKRYADNPHGDQWAAFTKDFDDKDDGSRFRVGGNVGPHRTGAVVSLKDLGPGAQVQRLVDGGLLQPLTAAEVEALAVGESEPVAEKRFDPQFNIGRPHDVPTGTVGAADAGPSDTAPASAKAPEVKGGPPVGTAPPKAGK